MSVKDTRYALERLKGEQKACADRVAKIERFVEDNEKRLDDLRRAQEIIQAVARQTQQQLEYHVSEITTLALASVFPNPYKLHLDFELKRGRSEAVLSFGREGARFAPLASSGGGPVDVAAFGLRVALWSLRSPRTRPVLVLDEPFRFVSRNLQARASEMVKEVSRRLRIQFIIVTHEETLIEHADKVIEVEMKNGRSVVK
jgi:DNA repair exonuclease SbcCD ATPase subunit